MDLWLASLREVTELFETTKEKQDGLQKQLMQREETLRKWVTAAQANTQYRKLDEHWKNRVKMPNAHCIFVSTRSLLLIRIHP